MPCLFAMFAGLFPRLGVFLIWIARPIMFNVAFGGSWLWPLLGVLFLPFTTLMYIILWAPAGVLTGWDWLWIGFAALLDVMHFVQTFYSNRAYIPGATPSQYTSPSNPL